MVRVFLLFDVILCLYLMSYHHILKNIIQIIERDSKDSTYKYALMRATIDAIHLYDQWTIKGGQRVIIKTGVITFFWLEYYFPIISNKSFIPQRNGESENANNLSFRKDFSEITNYYEKNGNFSAFSNDLKKGTIPTHLIPNLKRLIRNITSTITKQPMQYIGQSVNQSHYSIYQVEESRNNRNLTSDKLTLDMIFNEMGSFSIPVEYYEAFKIFGSFLIGKRSILVAWAEFTSGLNNNISINDVLPILLESANNKREVAYIRDYYAKRIKIENFYCAWSNRKLDKENMNIDHVIPFSLWLNNSPWNLLPSHKSINSNKLDAIPSPEMLLKRKDHILEYWHINLSIDRELFEKSIQIDLNGSRDRKVEVDLDLAFNALSDKCQDLIESRGLKSWVI